MTGSGKIPRPNYTQIPNIFLDYWITQLSEGEVRVACYVMRRTFGFNKESDEISFTQICEGITTHDGRQLDRGTGMARSSVNRAIKGLEAKGLLQVHRKGGRSKETTTYSLTLEPDDDSDSVAFAGGSSATLLGGSATLPGQSLNATGGSSATLPEVVAEGYLQKKDQNTDQKKVEQNGTHPNSDNTVTIPDDDVLAALFRSFGGVPGPVFRQRTRGARKAQPAALAQACADLNWRAQTNRELQRRLADEQGFVAELDLVLQGR